MVDAPVEARAREEDVQFAVLHGKLELSDRVASNFYAVVRELARKIKKRFRDGAPLGVREAHIGRTDANEWRFASLLSLLKRRLLGRAVRNRFSGFARGWARQKKRSAELREDRERAQACLKRARGAADSGTA